MEFYLAPMADISNRIFREICYKTGADHCYSEMISAKALLFNSKRTLKMIDISEADEKSFIQIFDSTPENFPQSIKIIEENRNFYGFDINMGCPVKKVIKAGCGSALLREPEKVRLIIRNARKATNKKLSIKIRKGFDFPNGELIAKIAEEEGADILVIHPRLKTEMFGGTADFEFSKKLAEILTIPVVHSGDITNISTLEKIENSKIKGIMIGRGTLGNPWIFQELKGKKCVSEDFKKEIMTLHFRKIIEAYTLTHLMIELKKHAVWYSKGRDSGSLFRKKIYEEVNSLEHLIDEINNFFEIKI